MLDRWQGLVPDAEGRSFPVKPNQYLVLDDKQEDFDSNGVTYIGRPSEEYDDEVATEAYLERYTQGLELMSSQGHIDITNLAYWKASSQKDGNPVSQALDDNPTTFWQSDGLQPHKIEISFSKRVDIVQFALFLSLVVDESYTPQIIKIYAGHSASDATLYKTLEVRNVNCWVALTFEDNRPEDNLLKCQYIRMIIPVNHENGKDTHLRGARIYALSLKPPVDNSGVLDSFPMGTLLSGFSVR
ncbi:DOC domain-containing protein [Lachancea thermotolerans]|uniref:KLTH0G00836p n=1 Tax=Lachancea thermotolerans (strain ATCC 56472 / CBS 6340 / NRRL Y-8284) TaxID=559295 RepID=C5DLH8_LACTC|nr:KLTH0G00836p [Lachancea thermotolerans CBS 6340]CAR24639.1 KLTH0G00836p [Lachancea thermotolerans CBS 6340]